MRISFQANAYLDESLPKNSVRVTSNFKARYITYGSFQVIEARFKSVLVKIVESFDNKNYFDHQGKSFFVHFKDDTLTIITQYEKENNMIISQELVQNREKARVLKTFHVYPDGRRILVKKVKI